ncbi:site-specific integrase [Streptomyces atroolivaceus]|uniref:integrase n=1 Tax=Streptomyces atroolivaceus TaxID=66869 RepID=UPI00363D625D
MSAALVDFEGQAKYTPRGLWYLFSSTALASGVPIPEVARWLGHRSVKATVYSYGYLLPSAWDRCREVLQHAMRPVAADETSLPSMEAGRGVGIQAAQVYESAGKVLG